MKVLICCTILLLFVGVGWGASTDTVKESVKQSSPTVKVPEVKTPVLDESPGNVINIGGVGKYYKKEGIFTGNVNLSMASLIIREKQLDAEVENLYIIIGRKQVQIERLQGK